MGVLAELENGTLSVGSVGDHSNLSRVIDGDQDARCKDNLGPDLLQIEDKGSVLLPIEDVKLHPPIDIADAKVGRGNKHPLHISLFELVLLGGMGRFLCRHRARDRFFNAYRFEFKLVSHR